jgi:hypothetical protein
VRPTPVARTQTVHFSVLPSRHATTCLLCPGLVYSATLGTVHQDATHLSVQTNQAIGTHHIYHKFTVHTFYRGTGAVDTHHPSIPINVTMKYNLNSLSCTQHGRGGEYSQGMQACSMCYGTTHHIFCTQDYPPGIMALRNQFSNMRTQGHIPGSLRLACTPQSINSMTLKMTLMCAQSSFIAHSVQATKPLVQDSRASKHQRHSHMHIYVGMNVHRTDTKDMVYCHNSAWHSNWSLAFTHLPLCENVQRSPSEERNLCRPKQNPKLLSTPCTYSQTDKRQNSSPNRRAADIGHVNCPPKPQSKRRTSTQTQSCTEPAQHNKPQESLVV